MKVLMSEKPSIEKLRFWGKIFGLTKNYYIVEVDADTDVQEAEEEEGINQKLFFVSTGSESWLCCSRTRAHRVCV